jgi:ubiquinone/menaquinone biosynthesis C-methylase UbiE
MRTRLDVVGKLLAKRILGIGQAQLGMMLRHLGFIDFPVPPYDLMRATSSNTLRHYYESGITTYLPIATLAAREHIDLKAPVVVLDFGCGVGRQLLHFTRDYPAPSYHACDVHPGYVSFVKKHYPRVEVKQNAFSPPLDYLDNTFDLIYSVSIFSHLSPVDHRGWLEELARVLKPGGYCFFTIEGCTAVRNSMAREVWQEGAHQAESELMRQGARYVEYDDFEWQKKHEGRRLVSRRYSGVGATYGSTAMSVEHIYKEWESVGGFRVIDVVEGVIDRRQDVVVLTLQDRVSTHPDL